MAIRIIKACKMLAMNLEKALLESLTSAQLPYVEAVLKTVIQAMNHKEDIGK